MYICIALSNTSSSMPYKNIYQYYSCYLNEGNWKLGYMVDGILEVIGKSGKR